MSCHQWFEDEARKPAKFGTPAARMATTANFWACGVAVCSRCAVCKPDAKGPWWRVSSSLYQVIIAYHSHDSQLLARCHFYILILSNILLFCYAFTLCNLSILSHLLTGPLLPAWASPQVPWSAAAAQPATWTSTSWVGKLQFLPRARQIQTLPE